MKLRDASPKTPSSELLHLATPPVVDAHHHLWRYAAGEFDWIDDRMAALRRDFDLVSLHDAMRAAAVDLAVAVQARQSVEETASLLAQAGHYPNSAGVVGWLPLADDVALGKALDAFGDDELLVGARHVVQAEPPGFLDSPEFGRGISMLTGSGLTFDLLLRADQLEEAMRFVDGHPRQRFVLDHLAKPRIAEGILDPWRQQLREFGKREHVFCKLSGMVTEDDWSRWSLDSLRPYLDAAVGAFGTDRLMAGSDWPVCLVATNYTRWWSTLREYFNLFSPGERKAVFGATAIRFYGLRKADPLTGGHPDQTREGK